MFSIKNCAYNLRGTGSRFNQQDPNTAFKHNSFSYIACRLWNHLPSNFREVPDLKSFVGKVKELKLGLEVCSCNVCAS